MKVLELPVNIHEVSKESQCKHLKKSYKKLAMKWHPDKVPTSFTTRIIP
jgi:DnaJ-class molecular chaperone